MSLSNVWNGIFPVFYLILKLSLFSKLLIGHLLLFSSFLIQFSYQKYLFCENCTDFFARGYLCASLLFGLSFSCIVPKVLANIINSAQEILCRLYAFDVHCNSFFPVFVILYGKRPKQYRYVCPFESLLQLLWYVI